ncbi:MAG: two-component system response regulator BaeR [Kiritimatiellia bacterium]|jgi:two-component system response regulator BaeR
MAGKILIVEDEPKLAQLLVDYLQKSGFDTQVIADGQQALAWITQHHQEIDFIILDLMLPNFDGMEICKAVRQFSTLPILIATAKVEEIDRLIGLELGADDYLCKPYSPREVVARVKAILRRCVIVEQQANAGAKNSQTAAELIAGLVLEEEKYKATLNGKALELTAVEFQILVILAKEPGRIFSRQQLMDGGYQDHRVVSDRTIDSHIRKLRKRIHEKCPESEIIHSVYGVGYKFELL